MDVVRFGPGAAAEVPRLLAELGATRVVLVGSARRREGADRLRAALGDRCVGVFETTEPQVPGEVADRAVRRAEEAGADWVVAVGGGTPIGVAKAVALATDVRVGAVPTTYSGSECTDIWGVTRDGRKTTGRDPRVKPRLVVLDPELTIGLPTKLSVESLLNAVAHAVEALYAPDDERAIEAAEESLPLLRRAIEGLLEDPTSLEARGDALRGAWLAGSALQQGTMALHHKLAHVLGGTFDTPHAATHAALLPHTLAFNLPAAPAAAARIARALGTDDAPGALYDLARRAGLVTGLKGLGVDRDRLPEVARLAVERPYPNPRPLDEPALGALLDDLWHDRRPSAVTP